MEIIKKYNLPYKFVGDFSFILGGKNPDFINVNGEKICVEVYDTINKLLYFDSIKQYQNQRTEIFSKYGWQTIFLDETDLKNENRIVEKLK